MNASPKVTGLVLAAGSSRRLGQPKQLLPFGQATLLDATLAMARSAGFSQRLVTLGGAATAGVAQDAPLAVCRYDDGIGHPFWFSRDVFGDLAQLHGDKAVWKLIESGSYPVLEVPIAGTVPLDVDTWDDYERLLAHHGLAS